jgi:hypothetical protein
MDAEWHSEATAAEFVPSADDKSLLCGIPIGGLPGVTGSSAATAPAPTYDDVRQLAVVIWARTKYIERLLADLTTDKRILGGLAQIDVTIATLCEHLDRLEDAVGLVRR